MKIINRRPGIIFFAAVLLASGTALSALSDHGSIGIEPAIGAIPKEKPQARSELDQLFAFLSSLDAAYAAANRAQAQAKLEEAKSTWNKVLPASGRARRKQFSNCLSLSRRNLKAMLRRRK